MPTYHARGVSVRLAVAPLADTVNADVVLNKANINKKRCEEVDQNLLNSELLREKRVSFPGDDRDFELNWLGNVPFMQVQAGHYLFRDGNDDASGYSVTTVDPSYHQRKTPTYSTTTSASGPLALSLHVLSSDRTFVSGLDKQNKLHLKIEVLFNGQLSTSFFFPPYEVRSGIKTHHQVFAGYRTDYLAERPWIILPPLVSADGSFTAAANSTAPETRWQEISEALDQEAAARGSDKHGNLPPSATFLRALAKMEMPRQIKAMQQPHTKSFGVIDVLITTGDGKKVTSGKGYLKAPQRFIDEDFSSRHNLSGPKAGFTSIVRAHADQLRPGLEALDAAEDEGAEGGSDQDIERPFKRRAVTPSILRERRNLRLVQPIKSQTSTEQATKSTMSAEAMPGRSLFPPTVFSSAAPFPGLLNDLTSSPGRGRTDPNECVGPYAHHLPDLSSYHTPQEPYSFPSSSIGFSRTPQMLPSPYSFQSSGPASSEESRRASIHMPIYGNAGFPSSPLQRGPLSMNRPVAQSLLGMPRPENGQHLEGHTPNSAMLPTMDPMLARRSSLDFALGLSSFSAAPKVWSDEEFDLLREDATQSPAYVPNMVPGLSHWGNHVHSAFGTLPLSSPYDRRYSIPLPQTGLFSVTTKPKSSAYSKKRQQTTDPELAQRTFQLRRLVITGKKGIPIIDHTWAVSQFIPLKSNNADLSSSVASSTPASLNESSVYMETASSRRSSGSSYHMQPVRGDPENISPAKALNPAGPQQVPEIDVESLLNVDSLATNEPAKSLLNTPPSSGNPTRESTPQRRIASGTQIRGVQGPKATTFWFDDPEEILRGLCKARRSKPPVKRKTTVSMTVQPKNVAQISGTPVLPAISSSSPLSSVPTTPEIASGTLPATTKVAPTSAPTSASAQKDPIPQLDGSKERPIPAHLLPRPTPSPTKLDPPATPKLSSSTPTTNPKKRKTPHRSPDKNAGRHKTVDNPPLNQSCVIAFAESKDKKSEKGVLRQVKSERQGVFKEEYGVFAARFYVAGN